MTGPVSRRVRSAAIRGCGHNSVEKGSHPRLLERAQRQSLSRGNSSIPSSVTSRIATRRLIHKRDRDRDAIFGPQIPRDVTFPGRIFDQVDVTGTHRNFLTTRDLDLSTTAERNHELPPRTDMPLT